MAKAVEEKGVSLDPDSFPEGGGLLDNVDVVWKNPRFEMWDYAGKGPSIPTLAIDLETDEGEPVTQYWSAGNAEDFKPSTNGMKLVPIGASSGPTKSTNLHHLLKSLKEAGFPKEKMVAGTVDVYEGLKCHMVRVKTDRKGLPPTGKKFEPTVLVVDAIISLPGEEKGGGKTKGGDDVEDKAVAVVMEILADNPKGLEKMKLGSAIFKKLQADKVPQTTINAIVQLVCGKDETFVKSGPWNYDGKVVSQ